MPRVAVHVPDLLFGSKVQSMLVAAGHEVVGIDALPGADVLVLDLTADADAALALHTRLREGGALEGVRTLGFYSHVEADVREAAVAAGLDQVVPRSRMAREGGELVTRLAAF